MGFFDHLNAVTAAVTAPDGDLATGLETINGIEYSVFTKAPASLRDMFAIMLQHADLPFLVEGDTRYSFKDCYMTAARFAHALMDAGVEKGDRIAICMRNRPEWVIGYIGALMAGAVVTPLNSWWGTEEIAYSLQDSGAKIIIADPRRARVIEPVLQALNVTLILVKPVTEAETEPKTANGARLMDYSQMIAGRNETTPPAIEIGPEDDATLMYTSGSTDHPKGAISSNRAVISSIFGYILLGLSMQSYRGISPNADGPQPASLQTIPLFHVTGCVVIFLVSVIAARKIVLMRKWDVDEAMRLIEREKITSLTGVPTMTADLMNAPNRADYDLSSLADMGSGGAARPPDHVEPLYNILESAQPLAGYGLTETNGLGTFVAGEEYRKNPACIGKPVRPIAELEIRGADDKVMPTGERGEICIKSVANVRGYWKQPEASAKSFKNGWLYTGDVGIIDEQGYLYVVDRIKDIIIRGGENIATLEVEAAIASHPEVLEVAVFGVPDDRLGEAVSAVIYARESNTLNAQTLCAHLAPHLAAYKIPTNIIFHQQALPRIASGKIAKKELREALIAEGE